MGKQYTVSVDGIALSAATLKTLLSIETASTQSPIVIVEWWVEFDGTSATATPVLVEFCKDTATITGTSVTPVPIDTASPACKTTAKHTSTGEGAGSITIIENHRVPPTSGFSHSYPLGREPVLGASGFYRIKCNAAAIVNATVGLTFEE